ncbi:Dps family protein [Falsiroseomonas sp.]|uniref:Dps family protein n=1 Tax=Falsiroseomonas sp. TaxID=2870721 RepID=UPI00271F8D17|nr:DNA starvation/stationary phase protection protein [Falsiroseomonas sp.]MDO9499633.1 DNA starvation/stationary phase protection protein [Falsiroseomonas sp.]
MTPLNDHAAHTFGALGGVPADTFRLHMKVHGFHWNVSGARFRVLHQMFEEPYNEPWQALDPIAERIRLLGQTAPGSLAPMAALVVTGRAADPAIADLLTRRTASHERTAWMLRALPIDEASAP